MSEVKSSGDSPDSWALFHVDMRAVGALTAPRLGLNREKILQLALLEIVGLAGSSIAVLPAYDYGFSHHREFDLAKTKTSLGPLPQAAVEDSTWKREATPIFSHVSFVEQIDASTTPFGPNSFFGQLAESNSQIFLMGVDASKLTYIHHLEDEANSPYRYQKSFSGHLVIGEEVKPTVVRFHVRPPGDLFQYDFAKIQSLLLDSKAIRSIGGRSFVGKASDIKSALLEQMLDNHLWLLTSSSARAVGVKLDELGRRFQIEDFESGNQEHRV